VPAHSSELAEIIDIWFQQTRLPEIALPVGTCKAAGGNPEDSKVMHIIAALLAEWIGLEVLDDFRRKDNPHALWLKIGAERAVQFAYGLQALSGRLWAGSIADGEVDKTILFHFQEGVMLALAGWERSLQNGQYNWESYWSIAEMTSANLHAGIAVVGAALANPDDTGTIAACRNFGRHFGLVRHILCEYECLWRAELSYPGSNRKVSLPVLYALRCEHPAQAELMQIVRRDHLEIQRNRVLEILEETKAKEYLMWAAIQEQKRALEAIESCPDEEGKAFLKAFVIEWFKQIPNFAQIEKVDLPDEKKLMIPTVELNTEERGNGIAALTHRSIGLGLRKQIRETPLHPNIMY
jgi:geranylgeranyl pyrophosphate synthase